jgi:hypothetical protein
MRVDSTLKLVQCKVTSSAQLQCNMHSVLLGMQLLRAAIAHAQLSAHHTESLQHHHLGVLRSTQVGT